MSFNMSFLLSFKLHRQVGMLNDQSDNSENMSGGNEGDNETTNGEMFFFI